MSNTIYNDKDEQIGYYKDLIKLLCDNVNIYLSQGDYEGAGAVCDNLTELRALKDYEGLIVLSENNGMGFTARKYIDTLE